MDGVWDAIGQQVASGAILATTSYVLLIASMLMDRLAYLRILAIASGVTGVVYFWVFLGDRVASFWESLFIAANLFQLVLTAYRDRVTRFNQDEVIFRAACIPGLSPSDARKLLKIGTVQDAPTGTVLLREHEPVAMLLFLLSGEVDIRIGDKHIARCGHGDFIGEIGVMSRAPATASAVAVTQLRYFAFDAAALRKLTARDRTIAQELELSFRHGLREKLIRANAVIAAQPAVAPVPG